MPKILVNKAFNLLLNSTSKLAFEPGLHDVTDEVANHWYTQQHADVLGEGAPVPVDPNSDGRRAMIDRLVSLFRVHVETLDVEKLAEMLAAAERQLNPSETESGEDKEPEQVEGEDGGEKPAEEATPSAEPEVEQQAVGGESQAEQAAEVAPEFDPALYDLMTDEELKQHLTERDGKAPDGRWGREKLLAAAKGAPEPETAETEGGEA